MALGEVDPREIKLVLEKQVQVSCWLDIEQTGKVCLSKTNMFRYCMFEKIDVLRYCICDEISKLRYCMCVEVNMVRYCMAEKIYVLKYYMCMFLLCIILCIYSNSRLHYVTLTHYGISA